MSDLQLSGEDRSKLTQLASILIPGTAQMPPVEEIGDFDRLLDTAVRACGYPPAELAAALATLPQDLDFDGAKAFASEHPAAFEILSLLVSAAYYMAPAALERMGYPLDRRHPAEVEEFLEEYETGILDPVMARGPCYRDTRAALS